MARRVARDAIANPAQLLTRASLLSAITATPLFSTQPQAARDAVAEYALALEIFAEVQRISTLYSSLLTYRDCAGNLFIHYDDVLSDMTRYSAMRASLEAAIGGLAPFGIPNQIVRVPNDPVDAANRFATFRGFFEGANGVATGIFDGSGRILQQLVLSDQYIINRSKELPPDNGFLFRVNWFSSPLAQHHANAEDAKTRLTYDLTALNDGIALLQTGLVSFPEGGGPSTLSNVVNVILGLARAADPVLCHGSGGVQPDLVGVLDSAGRISPFLHSQSGLLRYDAATIVDAVIICACRWAWEDANALWLPTFIWDNTFQIETSQHSQQASGLKQLLNTERISYEGRARDAWNRGSALRRVLP